MTNKNYEATVLKSSEWRHCLLPFSPINDVWMLYKYFLYWRASSQSQHYCLLMHASVLIAANKSKTNKHSHVSILLHILQIRLLHHHHMISIRCRIIIHWQKSPAKIVIIIGIWRHPPIVIYKGAQIVLHLHSVILIVLSHFWSGDCLGWSISWSCDVPLSKTIRCWLWLCLRHFPLRSAD